jgi:predicted ATP-grasp superfamily ATP-dependent carboligase
MQVSHLADFAVSVESAGMEPLILLGASVRAAAFSALRAGFAPHAIDLFADRDLTAICPAVKIARYPRDFLSALAAAPQAPWLYAGGLENCPRLVDRLAAIRPLLGNRGDVLRRVRDPQRLSDAAIKAGCRSPAILGRSLEQRWLLKPRRSSGGLTIRFAAPNEVALPPRGTYLQQYVTGKSASAIFVAAGGRAVLIGATQQLLGRDFEMSRPFLYVGSLGPLPLHEAELSRLHSLGNVLAVQFHLVGLFNVDFVHNDDGLWPVEVNPRYSASMEVIERVTGATLIDLHVQACQSGGLPSVAMPASELVAGKAVVYAPQDCIAPPALDEIASQWNPSSRWPGLADLPRIGEPLSTGQPVVTVFAEGNSLATVETTLRDGVATIERLLTDS